MSNGAATLLSYALDSTPDPLQASSSAQLTLIVSNTGTELVTLTQVAITLPLGQNADDLAATSDGIGTAVPDGWSADHETGSATFTFTPPDGSVNVGGTGYALALTAIAVNGFVGPTRDVDVIETASSATEPSAPRTWTTQLAKFPIGFALSELAADPVEVDSGAATTLSWSATEGSYTMQRSDQPNTPPWPVGLSGPEVEHDLATPPSVTFTLAGTVSTSAATPPLSVQRQATVGVATPPPQIITFSAAVTQVGNAFQVLVSWDVANVDTCQIPELSVSLLGPKDGTTITPTAAAPLPTRLTLSASNSAGSVSRTLVVSWVAVSVPADKPTWLALSPDGTRLYVSNDGSSTIRVLDGFTLAALCADFKPPFYPDNLVASPDGTRLYVTDDLTPALHALDVTQLPPVPFGAAAGIGAEPVTLPVTPDGSLVLVGNTDNISVTPIQTSADRDQPLVAQPWVSFGGGSVFTVGLTPDGSRLYGLITGNPARLGILDVATLELVPGTPVTLSVGADRLAPIAPDGSVLVYGDGIGAPVGGLAKLSPDPPFAVVATWNPGAVSAALPSADGRAVYAVGSGTLTPLALDTLTPAGTGPGVGGVWSLVGSPDGTRLFTSSLSGDAVSLLTPATYIGAPVS